jgi:hypothetical protein
MTKIKRILLASLAAMGLISATAAAVHWWDTRHDLQILTLDEGMPDAVTAVLIPTGKLCRKDTALALQQQSDCRFARAIDVPYVFYVLDGDAAQDDDAKTVPLEARR